MENTKIRLIEKIGFALTNLGNIPIMTLLNTYLLIFYTDVVGISPAVVGTLFLISRLLDGVSDPLLGFLIDRFPKTRFGKYKPILVLGTIICCINYLLVWFSPLMFSGQKILAISVSYILLGITFDLMDIPLNSLIPVLTGRESERNVLSSIKGVSYTVGPTLLNIAAPLILASYSNQVSGYLLLIVGTVIVVAFFTIVGTLTLKERVIEEIDHTKEKKNYSIKDAVKILKVREVATLFISMLFITAATNIFNGSLLYYLSYIIKDTRLLSLASFLGLFGALGAGVIVPIISKKIGKIRLYTAALVLISGAMLLLIGFKSSRLVFLIGYVLVQSGLGFTNTLQYSISADNVDIIRKKLGFEPAALIASLNSLIMKFAMAVGGAIPGFILSYTGYVANQEQVGSASTGIIVATFVIPFVLYVLTMLVFNYGYGFSPNKLFSKENRKSSV
ncbi:MFS transporter [Enterococcus sp. AZ196]|uniref:MFS transporter n=1 Tax=Enterococcus sp. AZ196 TaxID=2774659 RepID=UPI003D2DB1FC